MNLKDKLNPHLHTILDFSKCIKSETIAPRDLLTPSRIDLAAKLIYAAHHAIGVEDVWAKKIYSEHLRAWNRFIEGDGSGKRSLDDYLHEYDNVLDSISKDGFNPNKSLVPVGENNIIIDGAHRVAACLFYKKEIKVASFDYSSQRYTANFFKRLFLDPEVLESMILKYCKEKISVKIAVLFPIAVMRSNDVLSLISECGEIIYEKDLMLSQRGKANLIRLLYEGEEWLGGVGHDTPGVLRHTLNRFDGITPVKFIFFESNDMSNTLNKKDEIRGVLGLGNDSLHINDYHRQTMDLAEVILTKNGINWLNHALSIKTPNFDRLFEALQNYKNRNNINMDNYCLDGSAVLALYGLRDVNDLDYLVYGKDELDGFSDEISNHNEEFIYHCCPLKNLIYDPDNFLYWKGIKLVSLDKIRCYKEKRAETKDKYDVKRIKELNEPFNVKNFLLLELRYGFKMKANMMKFIFINRLKSIISPKLLPYLRKIYIFPSRIFEILGPKDRKIIYRGFTVHYSKGTSLIDRIRLGHSYEPELTDAIKQELLNIDDPVMMDIGANIGLMSLNILRAFPDIKIYAFEPGEHQADYFRRTIESNNLNENVVLNRFALGNQNGELNFSVHRTRHASGDGFFDTGRAGKTFNTKVPVKMLDSWWVESKKPNIDVIKIDTEGAELWIFQGGVELIKSCKPVIFLEMHPINLEPYPYDALDIYNFFLENDYNLSTVAGDIVNSNNMSTYLAKTHDYMAFPIQGVDEP